MGYTYFMGMDEYDVENYIYGIRVHGPIEILGVAKGVLAKDFTDENLIWVSFSCNQPEDCVPIFAQKGHHHSYKDMKYVENKLHELVDKIIAAGG
jgi:hypothetical protein